MEDIRACPVCGQHRWLEDPDNAGVVCTLCGTRIHYAYYNTRYFEDKLRREYDELREKYRDLLYKQ